MRLYNLQPGSTYQWSVVVAAANATNTATFATGPTVLPGATTFSFRSPAVPSGGPVSPYPVNWAVVGDSGQTWQTSLLIEHMATWGRVNAGGAFDLQLDTGDSTSCVSRARDSYLWCFG